MLVRRLKSELNELQLKPRFVNREVKGIQFKLSNNEKELFDSLRNYRESGIKIISKEGKREKNLGQFIFSLLTKRLLSSSYAFARTWWTHVSGLDLEEFGFDEAAHSRIRAETPVSEDEEKERRDYDAVRHGAGWFRKFSNELKPLIDNVSSILRKMGWTAEVAIKGIEYTKQFPSDERWEALKGWIEDNLLKNSKFRDDERLIIFTEYKDTQEYLISRFEEEKSWTEPIIQKLFGGAPEAYRSQIKREFNDLQSPLRILVTTDVAAEGLNLQTSCRYIIHQEIPWNPMKLEQRNGRVDRYGQSRDVKVFHFTSDDDADIRFLSYVSNKVNQVREDLGSVGQVLDEAVMEHFSGNRVESEEIDRRLKQTKKYAPERKDLKNRDHGTEEDYKKAMNDFQTAEIQMGINEKSLARLLSQTIEMDKGSIKEESPGTYRIDKIPPSWENLINSTLRIQREILRGSLPKIVFDPGRLVVIENNREIFRPSDDTVLLRLGHPIMQKALAVLRRQLWDQSEEGSINRWTILQAKLPLGIEIVLCINYSINVRNELGEIAYAMIDEIPFILTKSSIEDVEPKLWTQIKTLETKNLNDVQINNWKSIIFECWLKNLDKIKENIDSLTKKIESDFKKSFSITLEAQKETEFELFEQRIKELKAEKDPQTLERLRKELIKIAEQASQLTFSEEINKENKRRLQELQVRLSEEEWERQHSQTKLLKRRLEAEKDRIIEGVLPNRFSLASVDVHPVTVKIIVRQQKEEEEEEESHE